MDGKTAEGKTHELTFMGTAAGCGVPSFFCDCPACTEARENPAVARGDCGIMIRGAADGQGRRPTLIVDTPPDARHQLLREGIRNVDEILFTHAHFDHIGGLGEYEYLVQLVQKRRMPTFGSQAALEGILAEFHYMDYCLDTHVLAPFETHEFDGVRYTACPVTHAPGTYGYLIETGATTLFYASDTARLPEETAERVRGCDVLAMDATFWKRNWSPNDHHSVQECIEEGFELGAKTIYLTHMCMHYDEPITYAELDAYLRRYEGRVIAALDGMTLSI